MIDIKKVLDELLQNSFLREEQARDGEIRKKIHDWVQETRAKLIALILRANRQSSAEQSTFCFSLGDNIDALKNIRT